MKFDLPSLNYDYKSLEPVIDAQTMEIHHTKHHQAYINNLNKILESHPEINVPLIDLIKNINTLPEDIKIPVQNNGGGHLNHAMFWEFLCPENESKISENMLQTLNNNFSNFDEFKSKFSTAGLGRFGSGWVWLVKNEQNLEILSTPNQNNPITEGKKPILGVDLWEHAYYLKYQNRRNDYLENIWKIINWTKVEELFQED